MPKTFNQIWLNLPSGGETPETLIDSPIRGDSPAIVRAHTFNQIWLNVVGRKSNTTWRRPLRDLAATINGRRIFDPAGRTKTL